MTHRRQACIVAIAAFAAALVLFGVSPQAQGAPGDKGSRLSTEKARKIEENTANLERKQKTEPPETRIDEDPEGNPYVAGELIVTFEEQASAAAEEAAKEEVGAEVEEELPGVDAEAVSVPEVKDEPDEATREESLEEKKQDLESDPSVETVDYNYVREKVATPSDPRYNEQWGLKKIQAPQAHDVATGQDAVIAIIDGGAQASHPDLSGAVVDEYDYYNGDSRPNDEDGHGTHVSGISAARANNGKGISGTAPDAALLNYDVCGRISCTDAAITKAIDDAAEAGADVINMSLGGPGRSTAQENAVNRAWNKGVVLVAAAGNEYNTGNPVSYPGAYSNVIAVGATTQSDSRAYFSNTGSHLDIAAPGYQILSSVPSSVNASGYASWSGTSMATPFVSGVAALLASQGSTNAEIRQRLESSATDIGNSGKDNSYGHGLVNAETAVGEGDGTPPPPPPPNDDTTPPQVTSMTPGEEATNVSRKANIKATFSEEMDADTVNTLSVQLYRDGTSTNTPLSAAVSCDDPCQTATLNPSAKLYRQTWYMAAVYRDADGARDQAGNLVDGEGQYVYWWFKTKG